MSTIRRWRVSLGVIAIAVLGAAAVAGCGSTGGSHAAAAPRRALEFSQCMRANGVPNFPDGPIKPGSGIDLQSPAFHSALRACERYLPPSSGHEQPISASERRNDIALANCMRANGVPNFPDPGLYGIQIPIGSGPNPQTPAFQHAQTACKKYMGNG
jgi:hypothetical protein